MTIDALTLIDKAMSEMGLNYEFGEYGSEIQYPYFEGEYHEKEPDSEDGQQGCSFILTGYTRNSWLELEQAKALIENYFNKVSGKTVIADSGNAIAVFYLNSLIVPTTDAQLKKIQINLDILEWKVN